jgi:hypothetical protein
MLALLLTVLALGPIASDAGAGLAELSALTLVDQHGVEHELARHRGRVLVVMVVTAKRLRNIRPWERDLREHFEDEIDYLRITDVPQDSPATHERIAAKLVDRVPDGVSVLIDVERRWATVLDLDTSRPNILVIDGDGQLVSAQRGRHSPELAAVVIEKLKETLTR